MASVQRPRGNVPTSPLRWSIERGANEFKIGHATLRKLLRQAGLEPDEGGCYSTTQICQSLFGDLHSQRVQKERELVRRYALENQITEGAFLNRSELMKGLSTVADAMTSRIMAADVPRNVKEDLLNDLAGVPLILENVAHTQSKLARGNGSRREED